jgi:anti-anti-sigma factor
MGTENEGPAVSAEETADGPRLVLRGQMNLCTAAELHREALACLARRADVTVDCAQAEHLDTAALQVLLALKEALREAGKLLRLTGACESIQNYLRLAGLADALLGAPASGA